MRPGPFSTYEAQGFYQFLRTSLDRRFNLDTITEIRSQFQKVLFACFRPMLPVILATIEGSSECERLVLSLVPCDIDGQCVELQRQTWSDSLGWFTQSRVRVAREEINGLRSALGNVSGTKRKMADVESPAILRFPVQHSA